VASVLDSAAVFFCSPLLVLVLSHRWIVPLRLHILVLLYLFQFSRSLFRFPISLFRFSVRLHSPVERDGRLRFHFCLPFLVHHRPDLLEQRTGQIERTQVLGFTLAHLGFVSLVRSARPLGSFLTSRAISFSHKELVSISISALLFMAVTDFRSSL
jgi:hypothetical protein